MDREPERDLITLARRKIPENRPATDAEVEELKSMLKKSTILNYVINILDRESAFNLLQIAKDGEKLLTKKSKKAREAVEPKKPYCEILLESMKKVLKDISDAQGILKLEVIPFAEATKLMKESVDESSEPVDLKRKYELLLNQYRYSQITQKFYCIAMANIFIIHFKKAGNGVSMKEFCVKENYNYDLTRESLKFLNLSKTYIGLLAVRESVSTLMKNWTSIQKHMVNEPVFDGYMRQTIIIQGPDEQSLEVQTLSLTKELLENLH